MERMNWKNILDCENERIQKINKIKQMYDNGIPILLYGNGEASRANATLLEKYRIEVSDRFVDAQYVKTSMDMTIEDCIAKYDTFAVVISVVPPEIVSAKKIEFEKIENIKEVFYLGDNYPAGKSFLLSEDVKANAKYIEEIYDFLEDDLSRISMINFLKAKMSGDAVKYLNEEKAYDRSGIEYFNTIFDKSGMEEIFVDGGAYDGDTYRDFLNAQIPFQHYYAFEPDVDNYQKLLSYTAGDKKITCFNQGLYSVTKDMHFHAVGTMSSKLEMDEQGSVVSVTSIDETVPDATFIKLDIEGAEYDALKGAEQTIIYNRPKLAICCYHTYDDLWKIPLYIRSLVPEYRIYYRIHQREWCRDLIMYALC